MARGIPNRKPEALLTDGDDLDDGLPRQRTVPAGATARPATSAANSVFSQVARTPPTRKTAPQLSDIVIRSNIAKPDVSRNSGVYLAVLQRMQPGDSVVLATGHAKSMYARAKEYGLSQSPAQTFSIRKLTAESAGVWRDE